ncbi:putative e3 ubiquitin-protein ligase bre1 [Phaeomoniella chlamydospora]|uniref:E3 ubiquitin protein ligase n=1 Tax=Phaeomoniella chlamydospora TaxID=158046 RepID=A0A0G2DYU7_PHACM|nr:putative e3 ubiquitin-protein ligase bre1 [Phaeomoniella chlamydospora]
MSGFIKISLRGLSDQIDSPSIFPSALLFSDNDEFKTHLENRSKEIQSVINDLSGINKSTPPETVELQGKLSQLLSTEKTHLVQLASLQEEKEILEDRLEKASMRYMVAEKKLDRAKSATVAKMEQQALLGASKTPENSGVKREESVPNGVESNEGVAELEESHHKALAVTQRQKEQLELLESENAKLMKQVTELQLQSTKRTDEDYAGTELFKQLKSQHEDVIRRVNNLEAVNKELQEEAVKLRAERSAYQVQVETDVSVAVGEKESLLATADKDVNRIRGNRDELLAELSMRKSVQEQERESIKKTQELAAAREERIVALESENQRLKIEPGTSSPSVLDIDGLDADGLRARFSELDRKYKMLNDELSSLQSAFPRYTRLANQKVAEFTALEEKVLRLTAEKAKADQKFFAAMKSKETRDAEVRTLRLQNTKSADVVSQLKESEAASRSLIANLEKQLSESKDAIVTLTNASRAAQQEATEGKLLVDGLKNQVTELTKLVSDKDSQFASSASANRQRELEVESLKATLADTKKSLEGWKSKSLGNQSSEFEMLRSLAICTVCRKNFKDTVIKTCGHVLCKDCVDERITSRSRKCPNCNRSFGAQDYMKVVL